MMIMIMILVVIQMVVVVMMMNPVTRRSHHYQWLGPACGSKRAKCFKLLSTLTPIRETNMEHIGHKYSINLRQIYTETRRQIFKYK